jgi:hypothetical protein
VKCVLAEKGGLMAGNKNAILSAVLSLFIPGLGQIYCGKMKKGITIFVISVVAFIILMIEAVPDADNSILGMAGLAYLLWWGVQLIDAYSEAYGKSYLPL